MFPYALFVIPWYGRAGAGGWHDFQGVYNSISAALRIEENVPDSGPGHHWHIVDLRINEIVRSGKRKPKHQRPDKG